MRRVRLINIQVGDIVVVSIHNVQHGSAHTTKHSMIVVDCLTMTQYRVAERLTNGHPTEKFWVVGGLSIREVWRC